MNFVPNTAAQPTIITHHRRQRFKRQSGDDDPENYDYENSRQQKDYNTVVRIALIVSLSWDSQFKDESTERFKRVSETLKSTISNIYPDEISRKILVTVVKLSPVVAAVNDGGAGSSLQNTLVIVDLSLSNDENIDQGLDQMKSILESKMEINGFEPANPNWWRLLASPGKYYNT